MNMEKKIKTASKFLSLLLRHKPETIGLKIDAHGWASIEDLVRLTKDHNVQFTEDLLTRIVSTDDKQRYVVSSDGRLIRANQGHSIDVDLQLSATKPPEYLYHGTATRFEASILKSGLLRGNRQHVHLSAVLETAVTVGRRHGKPLVYKVHAQKMHREGHNFFVSENEVWLTQHVPAGYLEKIL